MPVPFAQRRDERCVKTVPATAPKSLEEAFENHRNGTPTLRLVQFLWSNPNDELFKWTLISPCGKRCILSVLLSVHRPRYSFNAFSIASISLGSSGVVREPKRAISLPLRSIRNLLKFQEMAPPNSG